MIAVMVPPDVSLTTVWALFWRSYETIGEDTRSGIISLRPHYLLNQASHSLAIATE